MVSCYVLFILSISNGRHGVFSPPPLWNRISPCFCGIPFPHRRGFVLCFLRHPLPHAPLRFCGFPTVRAGQSGRRTRPPFCGTGWFSLLPYTHTHHVFVNVWPFYLPTPLLWNTMVFRFALRHIDTHTHHVSVHVWRSLSAHALLLGRRSILSPPFPPPWYPVMYSCTSISNGRHGVFSPPPLWNRISLLRFCGFPIVRAGQGGRRTRPPFLWNRMVFSFANADTHTHTMSL